MMRLIIAVIKARMKGKINWHMNRRENKQTDRKIKSRCQGKKRNNVNT